jgi:hypothetical protein
LKTRIVESNQKQGIIGYLAQIAESGKALREYYGPNRVIRMSEANDFCRVKNGVTWRFDPILELCVDRRFESLNKNLRVNAEHDVLELRVDHLQAVPLREDHAYDISNAGLSDIRTSVGTQKNDMPLINPDEHGQCPDGYRYSSLQGGCVPVAEIPSPVSTMDKVDSNQRTVMGIDNAPNPMQSGYDYAKRKVNVKLRV